MNISQAQRDKIKGVQDALLRLSSSFHDTGNATVRATLLALALELAEALPKPPDPRTDGSAAEAP